MNQIDAMKSARLLIEGTAFTLHTLPSGQACICSQCDFVRGKVAVLDELRQAIEQAEQETPMFWYRPRSDGMYEGPLHNAQIEQVRKDSGGWVPLYTRPTAPAVPQGWQLVPTEPTEEMALAAEKVTWIGTPNAKFAYRAMLSAAPEAPAQRPKTDGIVGWRWVATCGSGTYQLSSDEPIRGYSYKAPVYELLPPAQPSLLQDPKDKPWQRDHYPQCKTCNKSFYVGETCGWVCDGVNMYSPLEAHIKGETK